MKNLKNNKWLIGLAVFILVVSVGVIYLLMNGAKTPTTQSSAPTTQEPTKPDTSKPPVQADKKGEYTAYDENKLAAAQGRKLLFFHAPWCPQCRALEQSILEQTVPNGITIFKVDYDTSTELKQKYGVTLQTTVVEIDESGNLVKKHVAYSQPTLPAVLNALGN